MPVSVCFVCLGNICRSPTAEAVFQSQVDAAGLGGSFRIDSAGTADWHRGKTADARAVQTARRHGVAITHRARPFEAEDFSHFDLVLAMDRENRAELQAIAPGPEARARVRLLRAFDPSFEGESDEQELEVPDPYYGEDDGFEEVFEICRRACAGLLTRLREEHDLG